MRAFVAGPTLHAAWNMRALALFLLGPITGLILVAGTFGLPAPMFGAAGAMLLLSLALFGILVRGERRRLARHAAARPPG